MPRGRKSQNLSQANVDDEDPHLSQSQRVLPAADAARLAHRVVRFVLATHGRGEPLRRDKVRQLAVEPQYHRSLRQILETADHQLRDVFGMSLEMLPNKRDLLLVNRLPAGGGESLQKRDEGEQQRRGLLVAVLALIFMNDDSVHEDVLWRFLEKLGVQKDETHECFGNVQKLLTQDFVRASFLKIEKQKQGDRMALIYHWGDAASLAVDQLDLLNFVNEIWGDNKQNTDWPEQHQRAKKHRQEQEERQEQQQTHQ